jgi:hypothetical protein
VLLKKELPLVWPCRLTRTTAAASRLHHNTFVRWAAVQSLSNCNASESKERRVADLEEAPAERDPTCLRPSPIAHLHHRIGRTDPPCQHLVRESVALVQLFCVYKKMAEI